VLALLLLKRPGRGRKRVVVNAAVRTHGRLGGGIDRRLRRPCASDEAQVVRGHGARALVHGHARDHLLEQDHVRVAQRVEKLDFARLGARKALALVVAHQLLESDERPGARCRSGQHLARAKHLPVGALPNLLD
jgi:hypothetical protein